MNNGTIYLGGPINGCNDDEANGWRDKFITLLPGFKFLNPMDRDYRGRETECVNEIVELDKKDIDNSDIVVAYCWQASWGTAMEIFYAWERGIDIIIVVPEGTRVSPWLIYHSYAIVPTLENAAQLIRDIDSL